MRLGCLDGYRQRERDGLSSRVFRVLRNGDQPQRDGVWDYLPDVVPFSLELGKSVLFVRQTT